MIYDKNPPYPHYEHLPYAKEPWKSFYVLQRLITTLAMVPWWVAYYAVMPRSVRPRPSWNIRQCVYVNFTRRIFKVTEVAGVTWGTRDPTSEPNHKLLKETTFEWAEPLREDLRTGILKDELAAPWTRVGVFVWPKKTKSIMESVKETIHLNIADSPSPSPSPDPGSSPDPSKVDPSKDEYQDKPKIVCLYFHGGGYCHMSAHESSRTSRIPRGLIKVRLAFSSCTS
jgi:hypothetical protein